MTKYRPFMAGLPRMVCLVAALWVLAPGQGAAQNGRQLGPALAQAMAGMSAAQAAIEALLADPDTSAKAAGDAAVRAALAALQGQAAAVQQAGDRLLAAAPGGAPPNAQADVLAACRAVNRRLLSLGKEILHLYETQDFQNLLIRSYEPLLGLYRVKLENLMQDYDDKLLDSAAPSAPVSTTDGAKP